jgi:hypothetical protein
MGKIKDKLREYNRSKNFLDTLCKAYFDATAPKNRKYICWKQSDEYPNCIGIGYDYFDWKGEYHSNTEWVSISELEIFNK